MPRRRGWRAVLAAAAAIAGCTTAPTGGPPRPPLPPDTPPPGLATLPPPETAPAVPTVSYAATPRAYRADAARHLYRLNEARIYKGKLPPLLYAIGVLNVQIDREGRVTGLDWMRPPRAPEVRAEIERTVRAAAPYPVPQRMGRVVYTDTWLFDRSGKFQLDTLTEGQLGG